MSEPFVVNNEFTNMRLVDNNGRFFNSISIYNAKKIANDSGLDLVCFNEPSNGQLAFCKIIDYGKWKYNDDKQKKKNNLLNKIETKEIRFSTHIADNDISHKIKQIKNFIEKGNFVIVSMKVHGRDRQHIDVSKDKMESIIKICEQFSKVVSRDKEEDTFFVKLSPISRKNN